MLMTTEKTNLAKRLPNPKSIWPCRQLQQVDQEYDPASRTLWTHMKPIGVPSFNQDLVEELHYSFAELQKHQGQYIHDDQWMPVDFSVIASRRPGVFNLGGDLMLFLNLIREGDREGLLNYAMFCIDAIYTRITAYDASIVTISLIQGDALGGGFEFALSSDIIVAEAGTRLGLPEILFNLFPGMGAYSFLARKIGMKKTEDLLLSGHIYDAEELAGLGIIDIIAPKGGGEQAVKELIRKRGRHLNGLRAIYDCRQHTWPISHQELTNIASMWVDAALRIEEKDLKMMSRLLSAQSAQHRPGHGPKAGNRSMDPDLLAA